MTVKDIDQLTSDNPSSGIKASELLDELLPTVQEDYSIRSCIEILKLNSMSGAAVVDNQGFLIGFISEYDLLLLASSKDVKEQISYRKEVIAIDEDMSLKDTLLVMIKNKLKMIPVTDKKNRYMGVISRIAILNALTKL